MGQLSDDILKWTLDVNGQPARKELTQVTNDTAKLKRQNTQLEREMAKLESRGKKGTKEWKQYEAQIKSNNVTIRKNEDRMGKLRKEIGLNNLSATELRKEMRKLKQQMDRTDPNTQEWKQMNGQLTAMQGRMKQVRGGMARVNGIFGAFKKLAPWLSIGAVVFALKNVVSKAVEVRAEFSRYQAVLENTLGSQKAANKEFDKLKQFAATTPFQLNELTGSYVKLANQGFKPTIKEMTSLGDLAAAMGKSFDQLTEAIIDAQVGENERLKEFGIRAQKNGDKIKYTFKGVTTEVDYNAESIRKYVLSLGDIQGVAGGMAKISKTIGGAISNAGDASDNFFNVIGKRLEPAMVKLIGTSTGFLNKMAQWLEIPIESKLMDEQRLVNGLTVELTSANTSEARRHQILTQLEEINPKIVDGLSAENIEVAKLKDNMKLYNEELANRIVLENMTKEEEVQAAKVAKEMQKVATYKVAIQQLIADTDKDIALSNATFEEKVGKTLDLLKSKAEGYVQTTSQGFEVDTRNKEAKALKQLSIYLGIVEKSQERLNEAQKNQTDFSQRIQAMKEILGLTQEINEEANGGGEDGPHNADAKAALEKLIGTNTEEQKEAIYQYFKEAGEGAVEAFLNAVEKSQNEKKLDFSMVPESEEQEESIPALDYAIQKHQETLDYKLLMNQAMYNQGLIGEQQYQDQLTELTQQAEEERLAIKKDKIEAAQDLAYLGVNFVMALMDMELEKAGDNEEKKKEIKKKYADLNFAVTVAQIVANTAGAIMKGFEQLGPIAGAVAAAILGATGLVQIGVANAQRQKVKGFSDGGFTEPGDKCKPVGVVHAGEWVASQNLLQNPYTRSMIDTLEYYRQNPVALNVQASQPVKQFAVGGYSEQKTQVQNLTQPFSPDPEFKQLLRQNIEINKKLLAWKPKVYSEKIKKDIDELNEIEQNR